MKFHLTLSLFLLLFKSGCFAQSDPNTDGKLSFKVLFGREHKVFELIKTDVILSSTYLLEKINIQKSSSTLNEKGSILKSGRKLEFEAYSLTDFATKKVYNFSDSNSVKYTLLPLENKVSGLGLKPELDDIKDDLADFRFEKDSIDRGKAIKLLRSYKPVKLANGMNLIRRTIFIDPQLIRLPFHPVSTYLDNKFKGTAYRLENLNADGTTATLLWTVEGKLNQQEKDKISTYIRLATGKK